MLYIKNQNNSNNKNKTIHSHNENQPRATPCFYNVDTLVCQSERSNEWDTHQSKAELVRWISEGVLSPYQSQRLTLSQASVHSSRLCWSLLTELGMDPGTLVMWALYHWATSTALPFFFFPFKNAFEGIKIYCVKYVILVYWLFQAEIAPFLHESIFLSLKRIKASCFDHVLRLHSSFACEDPHMYVHFIKLLCFSLINQLLC